MSPDDETLAFGFFLCLEGGPTFHWSPGTKLG